MYLLILTVNNKNDEWNILSISYVECELHCEKIDIKMT